MPNDLPQTYLICLLVGYTSDSKKNAIMTRLDTRTLVQLSVIIMQTIPSRLAYADANIA